jgi:peroxiredoxin Q/BCP
MGTKQINTFNSTSNCGKMIEEGAQATEFSLQGSDGKAHTLSEFKGKYLVTNFYPKDDTPGCTTEAKCLNGSLIKIRALGAEIVGVSKDGIESHNKFKEKYSLGFLLLSDPTSEMIKSYDSYGNKGIFGFGTIRNTFIIDQAGKIVKIFRKVSPGNHDQEIIEFLQNATGQKV